MTAGGLFGMRYAKRDDTPIVLAFIHELASYEQLENEVVATETVLSDALFGPQAAAECVIAELDGTAVGFAIFFHNFSTFLGRRGLYLEDLYVKPEFRGRGFGTTMLAWLARLAVERGCARFEWAVLDWNTPAIRFYENLGAKSFGQWKINRLTGKPLMQLASKARD